MESTLKRGALFFLVMTFLLLATACSYERTDPQTGRAFEEKHLLTLEDGCKVSEVRGRDLYTIYRIKCSDGTGAASYSCGKNCKAQVTYEIKLTPEQEEELKKKKALAKLTPAEQQALGLMPEPEKSKETK